MRLAVVNFHFERPEMTNISLENNINYWKKYSKNIDYYCIFVKGIPKKFPKENNLLVKKEILNILNSNKNVKFLEVENKEITEDTCFSTFKNIVLNNNYDGCFVIEDDILVASSYFDFALSSIDKISSIDNNFYSLSLYGSSLDLDKINILKKTLCYIPWGVFITKLGINYSIKYFEELINFKKNLKLTNNNGDLALLSEDFFISLNINRKPGYPTLGILGGDGLSSHIANHHSLNIYESIYSRAYNIGIMGEHNPGSVEDYKTYIYNLKSGIIHRDIHNKKIVLNQKNISKEGIVIYND